MTNRRRRIILVLGLVCLLLVIGGIFLWRNKDTGNSPVDDAVENDVQSILPGTWYLASKGNRAVNDVRVVITENSCTGGSGIIASFSGEYVLSKGNHLKFSETGAEFIAERVTDRYIRMMNGSTGEVMNMVRAGEDRSAEQEDLLGEWKVLIRGSSPVSDEQMTFREDRLTMKSQEGAVRSLEYEWQRPSLISIPKLSLKMKVYISEEGALFFVESDTGNVWELEALQ